MIRKNSKKEGNKKGSRLGASVLDAGRLFPALFAKLGVKLSTALFESFFLTLAHAGGLNSIFFAGYLIPLPTLLRYLVKLPFTSGIMCSHDNVFVIHGKENPAKERPDTRANAKHLHQWPEVSGMMDAEQILRKIEKVNDRCNQKRLDHAPENHREGRFLGRIFIQADGRQEDVIETRHKQQNLVDARKKSNDEASSAQSSAFV